jgi:hypothetical protein
MKEKICPVSIVHLNIPRKKLIKYFYEHSALDPYESNDFRTLLGKIEKNIIYLQHVQSIVEKILNRAG